MRLYVDAVRAHGRTSSFDLGASRVLPVIDARFRRRRRSLTTQGTDFPICYLTTTGRRTGGERTVPLLHVVGEDGEVTLTASSWAVQIRRRGRSI